MKCGPAGNAWNTSDARNARAERARSRSRRGSRVRTLFGMDLRVLERGELRVALRPRVEHEGPVRFVDVQRFFLLLNPHGRATWRRLVVGRKRMPEAGEREWAYVDRVAGSLERLTSDLEAETYDTKTRGRRHQPGFHTIARGDYAIASHGTHAHFIHSLPNLDADGDDPVGLRSALRLERDGSYVAAVFNPEKPRIARTRAAYDGELMRRFEGARKRQLRFAPLEPAFLDHVGCEIVLVCAPGDAHTLASVIELGSAA